MQLTWWPSLFLRRLILESGRHHPSTCLGISFSRSFGQLLHPSYVKKKKKKRTIPPIIQIIYNRY